MLMHARPLVLSTSVVAILGLSLTSCATSPESSESPEASNSVTIIVHDSFPGDEFEAAASEATGFDVTVITAGGDGELSNKLVLTKGAPVADAVFGVENAFASRLIDYDVVEPFTPAAELPARAAGIAGDLGATGDEYPLVPITISSTCINIDPAWFEAEGIAEPDSYEDLADPAYRGLTVLLDPTSSSTGASFLMGTVAHFGEGGFVDYWSQLADNEVRIEQSWEDAYYGQFTQGDGGSYPIVLSYDSSPAWTVTEDGTATTTKALLDTCSSQVEYAGVLKGAANPEGARAVVDYMLSREFQDTIADTMYVHPIDEDAYVPEEWAQFAPTPSAPNDLTPAEIEAGREAWLKLWSEASAW